MTDTALKNVLKEIIADNQSSSSEELVPRHLSISTIDKKAHVVIGVRRAGKTTFLHQIQDSIKKSGIERENFVELNFFDDRLSSLTGESLGLITEAYFDLYPEKKGEEKVYFFFDELQEVLGWEKFVERLLRSEISEVYITGSSANMLSKEISTQMGGRALSWELFPLSFKEFLDFHQINSNSNTSKTRFILQKAFREYFLKGGFPEVQFQNDNVRRQIHQEYFKAIINRDVVQRHDTPHPRAVKDLAQRLVGMTGSLYTTNRLYQFLRSIDHKLSKSFVSDCLDWFEDSYFLFSVYLYDKSLSRRKTNPRKIYCIDPGLVSSVTVPRKRDEGRLLETLVFIHLRNQGLELAYYKTKSGREVDFVYTDKRGDLKLMQVALHLEHPETKERELRTLFEALEEQKVLKGMLLTLDDEEVVSQGEYTIEVKPVWKFLHES